MPDTSHTSGSHHRDPITADCPVNCLRTVLSGPAFEPMSRAYMAPHDPPRTVGDVAQLHQHNRLQEIRGLGPRRIGEIELCLILAGLLTSQPTGHRHT